MKFRNSPSIIALVSGLFVSIITLIYQYPVEQALWILVIVMVIFYIIGMVLRKILNKTFEQHIVSDENDNSDSDNNLKI